MGILIMRTKWFQIDENEKVFRSRRAASSIEEAWEKTFEKWEWIVKGYTVRGGLYCCGLCDLFFNSGCEGCPIFSLTKQMVCVGTPHEQWEHGGRSPSLARKELDYLREVKEGIKEPPLKIVEGGVYEWTCSVGCKVYLLLTLLSTGSFQLVTLSDTSSYWGAVTPVMSDIFYNRQAEFRFVGMKVDVIKVLEGEKENAQI